MRTIKRPDLLVTRSPDSRRLDWLERHQPDFGHNVENGKITTYVVWFTWPDETERCHAMGLTLRDAIDAAMRRTGDA